MQSNSSAPARAAQRPPRIRHCPVCGIAMQGSRSRPDLAEFDVFKCLACETTISQAKPAGAADRNGR